MSKLPKYLQPQSIKKRANEKENKIYKHLCSGALDFKGDFSSKTDLIEHKGTDKKSIRITEKMLNKLTKDALSMNKENSILIIDLPNYHLICKVRRYRRRDL